MSKHWLLTVPKEQEQQLLISNVYEQINIGHSIKFINMSMVIHLVSYLFIQTVDKRKSLTINNNPGTTRNTSTHT